MSFRSSSPPARGETPQDEALPVSCPSCTSAAIVAAAKVPSVGGYWRCTVCGEIWSPARRTTTRSHGWRA